MKKCPFKIQELKQVFVSSEHTRLFQHRTNYNRKKLSTSIISTSQVISHLLENEFKLPQAYKGTYKFYIFSYPIIHEGLKSIHLQCIGPLSSMWTLMNLSFQKVTFRIKSSVII